MTIIIQITKIKLNTNKAAKKIKQKQKKKIKQKQKKILPVKNAEISQFFFF